MNEGTFAPPGFAWDSCANGDPDSSPIDSTPIESKPIDLLPIDSSPVNEELPSTGFQFDLSAALADQGVEIGESSVDDDPDESVEFAAATSSTPITTVQT